jgi:NAD(P)-dependent dehydrogenase (short-subunit alcohol dehydrogenase family)
VDDKRKTVLITGAAGGIGRATALRFAEQGAILFLADRDQEGLDGTMTQIREAGGVADAFCGDLSSGAAVEEMVSTALAQHGRIDVCYCNAGIQGALGPIHLYAEDEFDRVLAANTKSVFLCLRNVLPQMIAQKSGVVIVTCSVASLGGMANLPAYVTSKHAALGLVRAAAIDVAQYGVRVNGVCPGAVDTPMLAGVLSTIAPDDPRAAASRFAENAPTGRLINADEIADTVIFLCSDAARSITGTYVTVDGGLSVRLGEVTRSS